ncbi:alpha/beta-Hydrolases superfamily protein [Striga asiatica]|uniref:Alpha/beta-Hydrolases superfamily protein n=1 Tax=Striga asiatica TaxID=4170 RepID=A0A5A7PRK9_STRAF|nr:alpha/beta-Hydrolases superfamily protein [Striga asiatica]
MGRDRGGGKSNDWFFMQVWAIVKPTSNSEKGREWFGESGSELQEQDSTITKLDLGEPGSKESNTLSGPALGKVEGPRLWTGEGIGPSKEGLGGASPRGGAESEGVGFEAREERLGGLAGGGIGREEEVEEI